MSFAADGTVAVVYFVRYTFRQFFHEPTPPTTLAKGQAIDLSIQFTLFWMPLLVLLGWWTNKPLTLLFGMSQYLVPFIHPKTYVFLYSAETFDVAVLVGSCFLVNYVTADSKTNWAEGAAMVAFYCMIVCSFSRWKGHSIDRPNQIVGVVLVVLPWSSRSPTPFIL